MIMSLATLRAFSVALYALVLATTEYLIHGDLIVVLVEQIGAATFFIPIYYVIEQKKRAREHDDAISRKPERNLYDVLTWMEKEAIPEPHWEDKEGIMSTLQRLKDDPGTPKEIRASIIVITGDLPDKCRELMRERIEMKAFFKSLDNKKAATA